MLSINDKIQPLENSVIICSTSCRSKSVRLYSSLLRNLKEDIMKGPMEINVSETALDPTDFLCMDKKHRHFPKYIFFFCATERKVIQIWKDKRVSK